VELILRKACSMVLASLLAILPGCAALMPDIDQPVRHEASATREGLRLSAIFANDAERQDALDPLASLFRGVEVEPELIAELFTDELDRKRLASSRTSLQAINRIDRARLTPEERISYDAFLNWKEEQVAEFSPEERALTGVRPFNHFGGLHVEFPSLMSGNGAFPFETEADYRLALQLDIAFAVAIDNAILRFREGMANGIVEPKLTVHNMIGQLDTLLAGSLEDSPFYKPVRSLPDTVPKDHRQYWETEYALMIRETVNPAIRRLRQFLSKEYLPAARDAPGLWSMKGGSGLYTRLIERETTLSLDPEEIHALGLKEVARIRREMEGLRGPLGFRGDLPGLFEYIRKSPHFHPRNRQELIDGFAAISAKVDAQIPKFFSRKPKTKLRILPYPAFREKYEPGGAYYQGTPDGSRPGTFFFNTYDLPSRYLTGMTTLYLHEAVPGHHYQISLAQENEALPAFQRFDGNNAYVEGWALYAESLGYDMGLYDDPLQHWGTLDDEMLRAMRLVVDTGIHAKRWSREQAIDYMLANSGMSRTDATAEVERYIANPAQALSYKIGALMIQRLRRKAEAELGPAFDIRAFHDQVLGSGALPLPILEAKIDRWIAAKAASAAPRGPAGALQDGRSFRATGPAAAAAG